MPKSPLLLLMLPEQPILVTLVYLMSLFLRLRALLLQLFLDHPDLMTVTVTVLHLSLVSKPV
jgi:hypothetical protein